jgi:large conductance mechanosensitive channel
MLVKQVNRFKKKEDVTSAEPTTKECPKCFSEINIKATRCPNCTAEI